jgi:hypothetical protein
MARPQRRGAAGAAYVPGLLALRLGPICEAAIRALRPVADVVLLDATGRDHPRRAGLALHLGVALDLPSVGVTHRPLLARGDWPADAPRRAFPVVPAGRHRRLLVADPRRESPDSCARRLANPTLRRQRPSHLARWVGTARLNRYTRRGIWRGWPGRKTPSRNPETLPERRAFGEGPRLPTLDLLAPADITKLFWSPFIPSIDTLTTSTLREAVTSGESRP